MDIDQGNEEEEALPTINRTDDSRRWITWRLES
jgi:hypothetical protein